MKLINQGKVKDVYELDDNELLFKFSDRISVFDQIIPSMIPRKGESLARASAFWFKKVEALGIKTHFIELPKPNEMRVKRVNVIHDYYKMTSETTNYQIPLECVLRWYCAGSFYRALKKGKKKPEDFGLDHMPEYGEKLKEPFLEVGKRGLIHVDGKKEFAMDEGRNIMLIDTFGTADEDRWWKADEYEKGNIVEVSKEFVRKWYEKEVIYNCPNPDCDCQFSYKDFLDQLREDSAHQVGIPTLSEGMIQKTADLYKTLFEGITGTSF